MDNFAEIMNEIGVKCERDGVTYYKTKKHFKIRTIDITAPNKKRNDHRCKTIVTPHGVFNSLEVAVEKTGLSRFLLRKFMKEQPENYYYEKTHI